MSEGYHKEDRVVHGRRVKVTWFTAPSSGAPWQDCDGNGPVTEWLHKELKRPGWRVLCRDHASYRFYDWEEAIKIARKEGWGLGIDGFTKLMCELRRVPTAKQVRERAVENNFNWIRGWCNDEWHYCEIEVTDEESGVERSLWGIESEDEHGYHDEVISDLADEMWPDVLRVLMSGEEEAA